MIRIFFILLSALLIPSPVSFIPSEGISKANSVVIRQDRRPFRKAVAELEPWQQEEAYRLTISSNRIKIEAITEEGVFRANKTLEQLRALGEVPCGVIFDYPRFRHRGLMIDESRSFKGLDFLKKQIDAIYL